MASTLAILEIQDPGNLQNTIITIKGADGSIAAGANGIAGKFIARDKDGRETIRLDGQTGEISQSGDLILKDANGNERVRLSGRSAEIVIKTTAGTQVMKLNSLGNLDAGGGGYDGDLFLRDRQGNIVIHLGVDEQRLVMQKANGARVVELTGTGNLALGGAGEDGDIFVKNALGKDTVWVRGQHGDIHLGANGQAGDVFVQDQNGNVTIHLNGGSGNATFAGTVEIKQNLTILGKTTTKDLTVTGTTRLADVVTTNLNIGNTIRLDGNTGNMILGGNSQNGDLFVRNAAGQDTIHLDGAAGDIILQNADCAEDFDVLESEIIEPGTVMVLTQEDKLQPSSEAYDKKVAGVISGAGNYRPGLILDKKPSQKNRLPVALIGKVYCKVDADYAPIEIGDLLTTSFTPGHAMKADNPNKAFGAVIGKALSPLTAGKGLIPILAALQ